MGLRINLNDPDYMEAKEAGRCWGKADNYIRNIWNNSKWHKRILLGTVRKFGNTFIVTRAGMEHLTGQTEQEVMREKDRHEWTNWKGNCWTKESRREMGRTES